MKIKTCLFYAYLVPVQRASFSGRPEKKTAFIE